MSRYTPTRRQGGELIEDHAARFQWPSYWTAARPDLPKKCSQPQTKSVIERDPNKIDIFHERP